MHINRLFILQEKALRLIHFKERKVHTALLFFKSKWWNFLIKLKLKIAFSSSNNKLQQITNNKLTAIFNSWFIFSSNSHNYEISFATKGHLKILTVTTATYGKEAFINMATKAWNNIQSQIKDSMRNTFFPNELNIFLFNFYSNLYQT